MSGSSENCSWTVPLYRVERSGTVKTGKYQQTFMGYTSMQKYGPDQDWLYQGAIDFL